jgi:hypothetical protein
VDGNDPLAFSHCFIPSLYCLVGSLSTVKTVVRTEDPQMDFSKINCVTYHSTNMGFSGIVFA